MNPVGYARRWLGWTLHGKVALLTGAGGGIGAELALALASEGVHLCLTDRGASALNRTQAACVQAGGGAARVVTVVADLTSREAREALVQECDAQFGRIDFLINNAAVLVSHPRFEEHTTEEVDQVLATNLAAPMHLARLVLPGMRTRREGIILNVSSIMGFVAMPSYTAYCATKAGLNALAVGLRAELAGSGVRVANVCPGYVTGAGMYENMLASFRAAHVHLHVSPLHWLWEVSARTVARMTVTQLRLGAPICLLPMTVAPIRLLGALQMFAPDWMTALLRSPRFMPGQPFFELNVIAALAAEAHKQQ